MNSIYPTSIRATFSLAEAVIGLASVAVGSYFLYQNLDCPPEVGGECTAWGLLGAAMFLLPGAVVALAGMLSYRWTRISIRNIQIVLIGILTVYFVWLFALT